MTLKISPDDLIKIVVGVDPAITNKKSSDETGIIVAASGPHQPSTCNLSHCLVHAYILEDASLKGTTREWAEAAVAAYYRWNAGRMVIEGQSGRDLLTQNVHQVDPTINVDLVNAGKSKFVRAEPVAALYEQGRVHHLGTREHFAKLEDQMSSFVPHERNQKSPDRMDALVYAVVDLDINSLPTPKRKGIAEGIAPEHFSQLNSWSAF